MKGKHLNFDLEFYVLKLKLCILFAVRIFCVYGLSLKTVFLISLLTIHNTVILHTAHMRKKRGGAGGKVPTFTHLLIFSLENAGTGHYLLRNAMSPFLIVNKEK